MGTATRYPLSLETRLILERCEQVRAQTVDLVQQIRKLVSISQDAVRAAALIRAARPRPVRRQAQS